MSKTRQALGAELQATIFQSLDDEALEHLEETLIYADVGAPTTARSSERLEGEVVSGDLTGGEDLTRRLRELLAETARVGGGHDLAHGEPDGDPGGGGERHRQDHHDREGGVAPAEGAGKVGAAGRGRHVSGRRRRAAHGWAERAGCEIVRGSRDPTRARWSTTPSRRRGPRPRRGDHRHRRAPPHPAPPHGRAAEGPKRDRRADPGRAARDAAHDRRDHRPERAAAGAAVPRGGATWTASSSRSSTARRRAASRSRSRRSSGCR